MLSFDCFKILEYQNLIFIFVRGLQDPVQRAGKWSLDCGLAAPSQVLLTSIIIKLSIPSLPLALIYFFFEKNGFKIIELF